ncbi:fasciclin domain-containing protein [Pontibacter sp. SGAir0037]|uniref:fasciclin domain-containing protein n=1 Tax=Pontibacter sp. SGAir0037 TaxID=2571030 RepID=UPI0010CCDC88|nr:fasciclin domain-containing protein [Pontibacter sp. SGAir0037]QCR23314.1 hypothetical protein C1N53_13850 [Pontibacter sp. SGAir0037]
MKKTNLMWGAIFVLGISTMSCDLRRDTEAEEETQSENLRGETRNQNPAFHVDTKDGPETGLTRADVGGREMTSGKNIMENVTVNKELTMFTSALKQAGLIETLNGTGPYTIFAPTDQAFESLSKDEMKETFDPDNREKLKELVNNHLVTGKLTAADLQDGAMLKTVGGKQLKISKAGNQLTVNGAAVQEADQESSNGVIHTISQVLEPAQQ